jgi:TrbL/VirB6 plasmid conjugal transfer protein
MTQPLFRFLKKLTLGVCVSLMASLMVSVAAHAQSLNSGGTTPSSSTSTGTAATSTAASSTTATGATGNGLATSGTSISTALTNGQSQWQSITSSILTTAATGANTLSTESDKLAYGLAVITIVLAGIEFAGTHHPTGAWVKLFETLGGLGFFAGTYTGYSTAGPGLYNWFTTLADDIQGSQGNTTMWTAGDTILNGILHSFDNVHVSLTSIPLDQIFQIIFTDAVALIILVIVIVTCIIYMYYSYAGLVQAGIGIIFGKIGIALGFHSFTRSYFMSWLGFMVHAGMYTAVASAMNYLVINNVVQQIATVAGKGGGTSGEVTTLQSVIQMEVLAIFVLFLSFEIPKIAGMFGSGSVGGGTMMNMLVAGGKGLLGGKK